MDTELSLNRSLSCRAAFAWLALALLLPASAPPAAAGSLPVNANPRHVAIHGYDPVAYHAEQRPMPGSAAHTYTWRGATWHFASARNRDLFAATPERYAPQFGGYCAWAVSRGYTADIDPQAWAVVDGRLYLNYSRRVQSKWEKDRARNIALAEANWPKLVGK